MTLAQTRALLALRFRDLNQRIINGDIPVYIGIDRMHGYIDGLIDGFVREHCDNALPTLFQSIAIISAYRRREHRRSHR